MKNVSREAIIRTIILIVTMVNQALTMFGKNPLPFAEDDIYMVLTSAFTIVATVWAWWKNNSFTSAAIEADSYMKKIKEEGE